MVEKKRKKKLFIKLLKYLTYSFNTSDFEKFLFYSFL